MKRPIYVVVPTALLLMAVPATAHRCDADARQKAVKLLALHTEGGAEISDDNIDKTVRTLKPIRALKGKGRFDVLEVDGYVYKATYRTRLIYAQIKDSCLLMGQEILERADPY